MEQLSDLSGLTFGSLAAENDASLQDYFVRTETFERVADAEKWLLLGNRGTGKTAIFQSLANSRRREGRKVIELRPDDYSYELARDTLVAEAEGSWQKSGAYNAAWKWVLLQLTVRECANPTAAYRRRPEGRLYSFMRDRYQDVHKNPIDWLISYLKRIEGFKIGKYEAGVQTKELQELFRLDELSPIVDDLKSVLKNSPVDVYIDELDRGWDSSEDAQHFVSGLFRAAVGLNQEYPNLNIYLSLRQELYESIPLLYDDTQKHRDVIEQIRWDERRLLAMMAGRIRATVPEAEELSDEQSWGCVFGEVLSYRNTRSFNYVVDRTLNRPRELIAFATAIREAAVERGTAVDYPVIADAERKYSKDRFDDIVSEYRFQYPGLGDVLEQFRGSLYRFDRSDLVDRCETIILSETVANVAPWLVSCSSGRALIEVLWEVGFLLARNVGGQKGLVRSGSQYVGAYHVSSLALDAVQNFKVHPLFHSHLQLKEK